MNMTQTVSAGVLAATLSLVSPAQAGWEVLEDFSSSLGQFQVVNNGSTLLVTAENGRMHLRKVGDGYDYLNPTQITLSGAALTQAKGARWTLATTNCGIPGSGDAPTFIIGVDLHEAKNANQSARRAELKVGAGTSNNDPRWVISLETSQGLQQYKTEQWYEDLTNSVQRFTLRFNERLIAARVGQSPMITYAVPARHSGPAMNNRTFDLTTTLSNWVDSNCSVWIDNFELLM